MAVPISTVLRYTVHSSLASCYTYYESESVRGTAAWHMYRIRQDTEG